MEFGATSAGVTNEQRPRRVSLQVGRHSTAVEFDREKLEPLLTKSLGESELLKLTDNLKLSDDQPTAASSATSNYTAITSNSIEQSNSRQIGIKMLVASAATGDQKQQQQQQQQQQHLGSLSPSQQQQQQHLHELASSSFKSDAGNNITSLALPNLVEQDQMNTVLPISTNNIHNERPNFCPVQAESYSSCYTATAMSSNHQEQQQHLLRGSFIGSQQYCSYQTSGGPTLAAFHSEPFDTSYANFVFDSSSHLNQSANEFSKLPAAQIFNSEPVTVREYHELEPQSSKLQVMELGNSSNYGQRQQQQQQQQQSYDTQYLAFGKPYTSSTGRANYGHSPMVTERSDLPDSVVRVNHQQQQQQQHHAHSYESRSSPPTSQAQRAADGQRQVHVFASSSGGGSGASGASQLHPASVHDSGCNVSNSSCLANSAASLYMLSGGGDGDDSALGQQANQRLQRDRTNVMLSQSQPALGAAGPSVRMRLLCGTSGGVGGSGSSSSGASNTSNHHSSNCNVVVEQSMEPELMFCEWVGCENTFMNMREFVKHLEERHVNSGPREKNRYFCLWSNCKRNEQEFNARYKLLIHMRVHSGEKPYLCGNANCKKSFSRLENLKIHQRSHTGEKPYKCNFDGCSKSFTNSSDRIKHHKTHRDPKPYSCNYSGCTKRYTDPSSLRKHLRAHKRAQQLAPGASFNADEPMGQQQLHPHLYVDSDVNSQQQPPTCAADFDPNGLIDSVERNSTTTSNSGTQHHFEQQRQEFAGPDNTNTVVSVYPNQQQQHIYPSHQQLSHSWCAGSGLARITQAPINRLQQNHLWPASDARTTQRAPAQVRWQQSEQQLNQHQYQTSSQSQQQFRQTQQAAWQAQDSSLGHSSQYTGELMPLEQQHGALMRSLPYGGFRTPYESYSNEPQQQQQQHQELEQEQGRRLNSESNSNISSGNNNLGQY